MTGGEQFFEHGYWTHGPTLFQEDLKAPLVLSLTGTIPGLGNGTLTGTVEGATFTPE